MAFAVQSHGGVEGLVAHEIAHLLFIVGISYLMYRVKSSGLKTPGWGYFRFFLVLLFAWNVLTFVGHWLHEYTAQKHYIKSCGHIVHFNMDHFLDVIFYISRLDHLLLVPAMVCLYMALKKWERVS